MKGLEKSRGSNCFKLLPLTSITFCYNLWMFVFIPFQKKDLRILWYVLKNLTWPSIGESWFSFSIWVLNFERLRTLSFVCTIIYLSPEYLEFSTLFLLTSFIIFLVSAFFTYSVWISKIHSWMTTEMAHNVVLFSCFLDKPSTFLCPSCTECQNRKTSTLLTNFLLFSWDIFLG